MSQRTRVNKGRKPGASSVNRPDRNERRVEHRKVRRAAHMELACMEEPEDHALPRPHHTALKVDPTEKFEPAPVSRRRFKVWKTKAWKRRTNQRAQKAAAYRALG